MGNPYSNAVDFSDRLLSWFDKHGRKTLPWQQNRDPYSVWISEIMLQQTQVTAVIPYFNRFLSRFPTVHTLARSTQDEVMHHWSGLGYYARARNLHKAAMIVADHYNGVFPNTLEQIMALPGIGRSTAGAILAFCFQQRQPILDGNVKRVLTRVFGIQGYPGSGETQSRLWELADNLTPDHHVDRYTQAIMDLGATTCKRSNPHCDACPFASRCIAFTEGNPTAYPHRKPKKARPERRITMLLLQNAADQVLLIKRPSSGVWGGLWSFPELPGGIPVIDYLQNNLGLGAGISLELAPLQHGFTHFDLIIQPLKITVKSLNNRIMDAEQYLWYNLTQPQSIGLPSVISKLLDNFEHPE